METVETKASKKPNMARRVFIILLAAFILSATLMSGFASEWGYVDIERVNLIGDDGLHYSAILMIPETATNDNPAPVFIACHGGSADGRAMETWGLEMARRGYVVMCADAAGGGSSEKYSVTAGDAWNDYIYQPVQTMYKYLIGLPIVQPDNVHLAGISQGGNPVRKLAKDFPESIKSVSFIASDQVSEYACNVFFMIGEKDTVAKAGKQGVFVDGWYGELWTVFDEFGITANDQIEQDKVYGSFEDGTARLFKMNRMTHAAGTFNYECISTIADFVMNSTGIENVPNYIEPENSCWDKREAFGFICFALLMLMVPNVAILLMQIPFFEKIKQPMPKCIGLTKGGWWFSAACALVVPMIMFNIKEITGRRRSNAIWPAYHLNGAILWLVALTVFGIVMFFVYHYTHGKKNGGSLANYGLTYAGEKKINLGLIGRSFVLAVVVEVFAIMVLSLLEDLTGLTPHCWFINFSGLALHRMKYVPSYCIVYIVAFLLSALSMNVERRLADTGSETKDMVRAIVINVLLAAGGIVILLVVQWIFGYNAMVEPGAGNSFSGLVSHAHFGLFVNIGVAAGINTFMYRKTGSIYSGAFISALLIGVNAIMNNSL